MLILLYWFQIITGILNVESTDSSSELSDSSELDVEARLALLRQLQSSDDSSLSFPSRPPLVGTIPAATSLRMPIPTRRTTSGSRRTSAPAPVASHPSRVMQTSAENTLPPSRGRQTQGSTTTCGTTTQGTITLSPSRGRQTQATTTVTSSRGTLSQAQGISPHSRGAPTVSSPSRRLPTTPGNAAQTPPGQARRSILLALSRTPTPPSLRTLSDTVVDRMLDAYLSRNNIPGREATPSTAATRLTTTTVTTTTPTTTTLPTRDSNSMISRWSTEVAVSPVRFRDRPTPNVGVPIAPSTASNPSTTAPDLSTRSGSFQLRGSSDSTTSATARQSSRPMAGRGINARRQSEVAATPYPRISLITTRPSSDAVADVSATSQPEVASAVAQMTIAATTRHRYNLPPLGDETTRRLLQPPSGSSTRPVAAVERDVTRTRSQRSLVPSCYQTPGSSRDASVASTTSRPSPDATASRDINATSQPDVATGTVSRTSHVTTSATTRPSPARFLGRGVNATPQPEIAATTASQTSHVTTSATTRPSSARMAGHDTNTTSQPEVVATTVTQTSHVTTSATTRPSSARIADRDRTAPSQPEVVATTVTQTSNVTTTATTRPSSARIAHRDRNAPSQPEVVATTAQQTSHVTTGATSERINATTRVAGEHQSRSLTRHPRSFVQRPSQSRSGERVAHETSPPTAPQTSTPRRPLPSVSTATTTTMTTPTPTTTTAMTMTTTTRTQATMTKTTVAAQVDALVVDSQPRIRVVISKCSSFSSGDC